MGRRDAETQHTLKIGATKPANGLDVTNATNRIWP
jgi:hypothetical protein